MFDWEHLATLQAQQTMYLLSFSSFLVAVFVKYGRAWRTLLCFANPHLWLIAFVCLCSFALVSRPASQEGLWRIVILCGSISLAQWISLAGGRSVTVIWVMLWLIVGVTVATALYYAGQASGYSYHGFDRWCGPFTNPNIAGMVMALGGICAAGLGVTIAVSGRISAKYRCVTAFFSALICGYFLSVTFSRGAWLAEVCGMAVLFRFRLATANVRWPCRFMGLRAPILIAPAVIAANLFIFFGNTEWLPLRRVLSVGNTLDFSWRNRLSAWDGGVQMILDRPWTGFGWIDPRPIYEAWYRSARLADAGAVATNDYIMLAFSAGVLALMFYLAYLTRIYTATVRLEAEPSLLRGTCLAAAVTLNIGCLFSSGLFHPAIAVPQMICLELAQLLQSGPAREGNQTRIVQRRESGSFRSSSV